MSSSRSRWRHLQLGGAFVAFVLVLALAPRMDGPRIICGVRFMSKGGGPGLTNAGWLMLVTLPLATWVLVGAIARLFAAARSDPRDG